MSRNARIELTLPSGCITSIIACLVAFGGTRIARADVAFQYEPIAEPILSATFSVDFAAMTAHRMFSGYEVNHARLVDCNWEDNLLGDYDLSDGLFGTAAYPQPAALEMGPQETGWATVDIDASYFPALAGGKIGLVAVFTDTDDAMFAMDFISLSIQTNIGVVEAYYGWPVGNENNGFGIGLPDGADLPSPGLPDVLDWGVTGVGFDETISSKSIHAVPEPASLLLLLLQGGLASVRGLRR